MAAINWDAEGQLFSNILLSGGPARQQALAMKTTLRYVVASTRQYQGINFERLQIKMDDGTVYEPSDIRILQSELSRVS